MISAKYYCWLCVHYKLPFDDDCDLQEFVTYKTGTGRFNKALYYENEELMCAVVVGGSKRDFRVFDNIRLVELSNNVADLLINILDSKSKN